LKRSELVVVMWRAFTCGKPFGAMGRFGGS